MTWTGAKIRYIKDNIHLKDRDLGEELGVSASAVQQFRKRVGIKKYKQFTPEEKQFVKDNAHLSDQRIAEILGRCEKSIENARYRWGLIREKWKSTSYAAVNGTH